MKVVALIASFILLSGFECLAQNADTLQRYELSELKLTQPELIGKVGTHYMLFDRRSDSGKGIPLYILDSNKRLEKKIYLPVYAASARRHIIGDRVRFTFSANRRFGPPPPIYLMQVSELGVLKDLGAVHPDSSIFAPTILTNKDNLQLIYSFYSLKDSGIFFTGMLIDSSGATTKTLGYKIDFDPDFNQQPLVILDSKGNTHVIVAERLSSFRMSSAISINTIPFHSEEMTSETFRFERIKFNRLLLSDHPGKQLVQLQGFYYDGHVQNSKKGIVSLQLPYERGKAPNNKFNLFPDQLRMQLRKGLVHLHKKDDVMNALSLNAALTENGETLLSFWVRDVAAFEQPGEFEVDQNRENIWKEMTRKMKHAEAATKELYDRWLNGMGASAASTGTTSARQGAGYASPRFETGGRAVMLENAMARFSMRQARKFNLVNFRLDPDGVLADYSMVSSDFMKTALQNEVEAFAFPLLYENGYAFAKNGWMNRDEVFYIFNPKGTTDPPLKPLTKLLPLSTFISTPVKTGTSTYSWLLKKAPIDGGGFSLLEYSFQ